MNTYSNTKNTLDVVRALAEECHIILDDEQLHIGGERAVMRPEKYVLTGVDSRSGKRVVFKCADNKTGIEEIREEHEIRLNLKDLPFAAQEITLPHELFYGTVRDYLVSITEFIEQEKVFVEYPLKEQFFMTLYGFEIQESFHTTTREHQSFIKNLFSNIAPEEYLSNFAEFKKNILSSDSVIEHLLTDAEEFLSENIAVLQTFDGYLMHTDFVPHNFRINNRRLFILDSVAFSLGNKYESWARFINFMEAHSPHLVPLLTHYIKNDRGENEYLALRLMRVYKVAFLLNFYTDSLRKTEGDLHTLTKARLVFWSHVLDSILKDIPVEQKFYATYIIARDALRTEKEKRRQREFTNA